MRDLDVTNEPACNMELRDHFAGQALVAVIMKADSSITIRANDINLARVCYEIADAMLRARMQ